MKLVAQLSFAFGALAVASCAVAAPVVHDTVAAFSSIVANQGMRTRNANAQLVNVADIRSNVANMFDNQLNTMFSLGLGGTGAGGWIDFVISPTTNTITSGTVIELTNGGPVASRHIEFAKMYLGVDGAGWQYVGLLGNNSTVDMAGGIAGAALTVNPLGGTNFALTVMTGAYNSVRFQDASPLTAGNRDGFDISEFRLTSSNPVPEPTTLALLGAGLLGLSVLRRRKA